MISNHRWSIKVLGYIAQRYTLFHTYCLLCHLGNRKSLQNQIIPLKTKLTNAVTFETCVWNYKDNASENHTCIASNIHCSCCKINLCLLSRCCVCTCNPASANLSWRGVSGKCFLLWKTFLAVINHRRICKCSLVLQKLHQSFIAHKVSLIHTGHMVISLIPDSTHPIEQFDGIVIIMAIIQFISQERMPMPPGWH